MCAETALFASPAIRLQKSCGCHLGSFSCPALRIRLGIHCRPWRCSPEHNSPLVLLVVPDKLRVARIMRDTTCTDLRSFFACRTTFALGFAFCKPKCFSWSHCVSTAACGLWSFHRLFDGDGFVDHTVDSRRTPFFQHCDSCAADAVVLFVS